MDDRLIKKARKKFLSMSLAADLVKIPNSPLNKSYALTFGCCDCLSVDDSGTLASVFYCRRRWCQTCASINMATLINKYSGIMSNLTDLYFVTLTIPNCQENEIESTLNRMALTWRRITDLARKNKSNFIGLRKIELKVGKGGGFHPHYHLIITGKNSAEWLINQWLLRLPECSKKAQHYEAVSNVESALIELMKYATKLTCAEDSGNNVLCNARQMDIIFQKLHRKRLFQPFGGLKAVDEESFETTSEIYTRAQGIYKWIGHDWFHTRFGHALTNYIPESMELSIYRADRT